MLLDVPSASVDAVVDRFEEAFYEGDQPIMQEIYPLKVNHKVQNVKATIGGVTLKEADLKGAKITPKAGKHCDVEVLVQSSAIAKGMLDKFAAMLRETVDVKIIERQLKIVAMEQ